MRARRACQTPDAEAFRDLVLREIKEAEVAAGLRPGEILEAVRQVLSEHLQHLMRTSHDYLTPQEVRTTCRLLAKSCARANKRLPAPGFAP